MAKTYELSLANDIFLATIEDVLRAQLNEVKINISREDSFVNLNSR
ncbi:hypothetical protein SAMN04487764_2594 [Gillisia sp. Hel1_33_143]|nr:hypothetical protein [Gillisia sp. Hel1_33_143]SDS60168.1 hypothetical protein SAMN04487764_2594 [Gillisia sp. Hel1_33_143]